MIDREIVMGKQGEIDYEKILNKASLEIDMPAFGKVIA